MSDSEIAGGAKSSFDRMRVGADTVAYHRLAGQPPGIVFIGGFRSDMTGTKATWLEALAQRVTVASSKRPDDSPWPK